MWGGGGLQIKEKPDTKKFATPKKKLMTRILENQETGPGPRENHRPSLRFFEVRAWSVQKVLEWSCVLVFEILTKVRKSHFLKNVSTGPGYREKPRLCHHFWHLGLLLYWVVQWGVGVELCTCV